MNRKDIEKILPHRAPMLLLDQAELVGDEAVGEYTVRGDEFFLQGHFPGNPVVPGVVLCEMMAQACCVLLQNDMGENATPYFTGLNKVKFREKVLPFDTITVRCRLEKQKPPFYFACGTAYVKGKIAAEGEFSFAILGE
ncbi:MAG: beta-hydroxyacyl-ACP dehydratase [Clostridia bacterium]|nr:beta-hydroxyacyl-ACP dehydratase [Clostridia bacterium]